MVRTVLVLYAATAIAAPAQVVTPRQPFFTVVNFDGTNGLDSYGALVQGADGSLYGTTQQGGDPTCNGAGCGTVFKISPIGQLTTLYVFCDHTFPVCPDGANPYSGLVQATDGNFYGTTYGGGIGPCQENTIAGCGTIFKITAGGQFTTLYDFCSEPNCADGIEPLSRLIQAANGNLYGSTFGGDTSNGTLFAIALGGGKLTTFHTFDGSDGSHPAGLVQATSGDFYGTTGAGGAHGVPGKGGTVFKITPGGKLTTLYSFCAEPRCADGNAPSGLIQATNGNFYGTTVFGGADHDGGTVFTVTPGGQLTTLYSFCSQPPNCADGAVPYAGLVQATEGNFYGATYSNGANGLAGTLFKITAGGSLTTLYNFCAQPECTDGTNPSAGLLQGTDGALYGTTTGGGDYLDGTVYRFSVGLGSFVKTLPGSGRVGGHVAIIGQELDGATRVTFNGMPAKFAVRSASLILAQVPDGATTGYVTVTTHSGTLKSNVPFHVIP